MSDNEKRESSDNSEDEVFNDIITLGRLSEFEAVVWSFPKTNRCPMKDCLLSCSSRSVCLGHFHLMHADTTMPCTVCNELLSVKNPLNLYRHYQDYHPGMSTPKLKPIEKLNGKCTETEHIQQAKMSSYQSDEEMDQYSEDKHVDTSEQNAEDDGDDAIILTGCGQITQWIWPKDLQRCYVQRCRSNIKNRREAINHYRDTHANTAVLCPLCDKPIYAPWPNKYKLHFDRIHPNVAIPFDFKTTLNDSAKLKSQKRKVRVDSNDSEDDWKSKNHAKQLVCENDDSSFMVQLKHGAWYFPDTPICPVISCRKVFNSRREAMDHYKQQHAMFAIYCHFCNKPIRIDAHKNEFVRHFQRIHPNQKIPHGLGKSDNQSFCIVDEAQLPDDHAESDEDDSKEVDDIIVLGACGLELKWQYPLNSTRCPVNNCHASFNKRSDAIAHFKTTHAHKSTLCPACEKPVYMTRFSDIAYHYNRKHPNMDIPLYFQKVKAKKRREIAHANVEASEDGHDESDEEDDMIVLRGCGLKFNWKFPKKTGKNRNGRVHCPVKNCYAEFGVRSDVIVHFKKFHAAKATLCLACKKPRMMRTLNDMAYHYRMIHPGVKVPACYGGSSESTDVYNKEGNSTDAESDEDVRQSFQMTTQMGRFGKTYSRTASQPSKEMQLFCPLRSCNYATTQMTELCNHWTERHDELEFPKFRGGKSSPYIVHTQKPTTQRQFNIETSQSNLLNGNSTAKKCLPSTPNSTVSISSESEDDSKPKLCQVKAGGWFTLTSDEDDGDDDKDNDKITDQGQNGKRRGESVSGDPKMPHWDISKKNDYSIILSSSTEDSSDSDGEHPPREKRPKHCTDDNTDGDNSCSD